MEQAAERPVMENVMVEHNLFWFQFAKVAVLISDWSSCGRSPDACRKAPSSASDCSASLPEAASFFLYGPGLACHPGGPPLQGHLAASLTGTGLSATAAH